MSLTLSAVVAMTVLLAATPTATIDLLPPETPGSFGVDDRSVIATVDGAGLQIYECTAAVEGLRLWMMRERMATLFRKGMVVGHYSDGWWAFTDGSAITGKVVAIAGPTVPGSVSQLKIDVSERRGAGELASTTMVLEVATSGGKLDGNCSTIGTLQAVPYRATYAYLR